MTVKDAELRDQVRDSYAAAAIEPDRGRRTASGRTRT
jgi:hypothetical protein